MKMNHEKITNILNEALLTDEEMTLGWEPWRSFSNPFAAWDLAMEEDLGHDHATHPTQAHTHD